MTPRPLLLALAALCLAAAPLAAQHGNVVDVADDDPAMNAAVDRARRTTDRLIERLRAPSPTQTYVAVKARFAEGDAVEHMWVDGLRFDGTNLVGELANEPAQLRRVRMGDPVTVAPGEITDWIAIDDGRLCGGYTVRVLRDRMTPAQRIQHDKRLGVRSFDGDC